MTTRPAALVLLAALGAGPAALAVDPEAALKRWAAAAGGEKALRRVKSATLAADASEEGIAATVEMAVARDGLRRVTSQLGDVYEEVVAGPSTWVRDWNGHVRDAAGRDRADQRTEALIQALLYAGAIDDAAVWHPELSGESVLRFAPEGMAPFEVQLDEATSLPSRFVRSYFGDDVIIETSDWRTVEGVKVPFKLKLGGGEAETEDSFVVRRYAPSRKGLAPFRRPKPGAPDVVFASGRSALGIPFNFENDHLMIDVTVNGHGPMWFMLDTGAESSYINSTHMAEFGLTPFGASSAEGGGNRAETSNTKVAVVGIPGVEIRNQRHRTMDMTGLEKIYGRAMGGMFGYDFFSRFVVRVDYDEKVIDLIDPAGYTYTGAGKPVPFIIEEWGHPHVTGTIVVPTPPSIQADLVIDCGAADTVNLATPFVMENDLLTRARKKPAGAPTTMAGSEKEVFAQTSVRGKLSALTLGPYTLEEIPNNLMVQKTGAYGSRAFSGTVGQGILRRFTTIYDYTRNVMILEPNADFEKPFKGRKTFGATYLSDGPDYRIFRVTGVRKEGPAEKAGFKKDDIITAIDGTPASALRLADVRRLLTEEGAARKVDLKRGDELVALEFTVSMLSLEND